MPRYGQAALMPTLARPQVPMHDMMPAAVRKPNLPQVMRERVGTAQKEVQLSSLLAVSVPTLHRILHSIIKSEQLLIQFMCETVWL